MRIVLLTLIVRVKIYLWLLTHQMHVLCQCHRRQSEASTPIPAVSAKVWLSLSASAPRFGRRSSTSWFGGSAPRSAWCYT